MKFGLCTGVENLPLAEKLGYDYVECALNDLAGRSDAEFAHLKALAAASSIPVSKCNCLLPGDVYVTGPDADEKKQRAYLDTAFARARDLGIRLAVFGSGGARRVPEGWPFDTAWRQMADFLKLLAEYGEKYDLSIAIEPLRRQECNIVNLVSEGTALAAWVHHPRIGVLGDTFHMRSSHENTDALKNAGSKLLHLHISHALADLSGRIYPIEDDQGEHEALFRTLRDMDYQGDISIEAGCEDMEKEGSAALRRLQEYRSM